MTKKHLKPIAIALMCALALPVYARYSKDLENQAKQGNFDAQIELAEAYLKGNGIGVNEKKGVKILEDAIKDGNVKAKLALAKHYLPFGYTSHQLDINDSKSFKRAFSLLQEAAKNGDTEAIIILAKIYSNGVKGTKRYGFGDSPSDEYILGDKMPYVIVAKDQKCAEALVKELPEPENAEDMKKRGDLYKSIGNSEKANEYYRQAAEARN